MYEVVSQKGVIISVQIFLKERLALTGMTGKRGDGVARGGGSVILQSRFSFCISER